LNKNSFISAVLLTVFIGSINLPNVQSRPSHGVLELSEPIATDEFKTYQTQP